MSASSPVKAIPDGMTAITPHLVCDGAAAAIEFYQKAFGAVDHGRVAGQDGKLMHGYISINGAAIFLVDEVPEWGCLGPKKLNGSPVTIHLYVEDVDAVFAQAIAAGATEVMPLSDTFWGDRYGKLEDPFGHQWSLAMHVRDVSEEEIAAAMANMSPDEGCGKPE